MELVTAARRFLLADNTIRGYVVTSVDGVPQDQRVYRYRLDEQLDGTGLMACVVDQNNGWSTPIPGRLQEFPILRVRSYADVDRDAQGLPARANAEDKAYALSRVIDRVLRRARDQVWGGENGLLVLECAPRDHPQLVTNRDEHGMSVLGDTVFVERQYNLVTAP